MKKSIYGLFLALFAVVGFTACSDDDDYQWASVSGEQVYFSNQLASVYEVSSSESSIVIPINRVDTEKATTVTLDVTASEGAIFTVPSSVTFDAGKSVADIVVSYDPAQIEYGKYDTLTIAIADKELQTLYGASVYTFSAGATAWVDAGTGQFRDGLVSGLYGLDAEVWNVKVMKNVVTPGLYRILNPYESSPYSSYYDGTGLNTVIEVDATDPDFVTFSAFDSGVTLSEGDGELSFLSFVEYYLNRGNSLEAIKDAMPENFGKLQNGIITFSTPQSWLATIGGVGYYYGNQKGLLAFALPGYVIKDYSISFSYTGRLTATDGQDYIVGSFVYGDDVESAKYVVLAPGEDVDAAIEGIVNGSVEAEDVPASLSIQAPVGETGTYQVVYVAYAEGEAVATGSTAVKFQSSKDSAETWTAIYTGTYTYGVQNLASEGELFYEGSEDVTLYVSDQDDSRYKVLPWGEEGNEGGLVFTLDEDGNIVVDEVETGFVDEEWGMIYATDVLTYGAANMASSYADGKFTFVLAYHDYDGPWAYQVDELVLTGNASRVAGKAQKSMSRPQGRQFKAHAARFLSGAPVLR